MHVYFLSNVDVARALAVEGIGKFPDPLVGHPLGAQQNWASTVQHCHVGSSASLDVVPKHGRSLDWSNGHAQPGESRVASARHVRQVHHVGRHPVPRHVIPFLSFHIVNQRIQGLLVDIHRILMRPVMTANAVVGYLNKRATIPSWNM